MATTESTRVEYERRVNRAIDHVRQHLADELTLAEVARVAAFSPFHFHRVFRALRGETVAAYVQRLRLERAAGVLAAGPNPSVLAVALDHGFGSAATFARAFRTRFGMTATQWRRGGAARWRARTGGKHVRKASKASLTASRHTARMYVTLRALPAYHVAYMRHVGPYGDGGIPELWTRLGRWMATRGLELRETVRLGIGHDEAGITEPAKCSYDACVVVPPEFAADRRVNVMDVPGGRYALTPFRGTPLEIEAAWERFFAAWLPGSGFEPDDRPGLEIYRGGPTAGGPRGQFHCELALPVRPG
jgi:AraC family transcriptional regulator